jgi:hypothetical protein
LGGFFFVALGVAGHEHPCRDVIGTAVMVARIAKPGSAAISGGLDRLRHVFGGNDHAPVLLAIRHVTRASRRTE